MNNPKFMAVGVGAVSEQGQREENQDNMTGFSSPFGSVYVVADGMGGHKGGAEASRMVVDGIRRYLQELSPATPVAEALVHAAQSTNLELMSKGKSGDPNLAGMGSTVVIAVIRQTDRGMELVTGHAGDSRAYRHRSGQLTLLTRDHTQVQWMLERGLIDEETARTHPDASVLTRAMGHSADLAIDVSDPIIVQDGDEIVLCSDGLSGFVTSDEINRVLNQYPEPTACAKALVQLALASGSNDNITVQCLRIGSSPAAVTAKPPTSAAPPRTITRMTVPDSPVLPKAPAAPPSAYPAVPLAPSVPRPVVMGKRFAPSTFVMGLAAGLIVAAGGFLVYKSGLISTVLNPPYDVALRMEGSTTIGDEFAPKLVEAFLKKEGAEIVDNVNIKDSDGFKSTRTIRYKKDGKRLLVTIIANGSQNGFVALEKKTTDLGMSSRPVTDDEVKKLAGIGNMRSPASERVVAMDGVAIIVNPGNNVHALTVEQVASIYSGDVIDWGKFGGKGPIKLYSRNEKSGTYQFFSERVLGKKRIAMTAIEKASADEVATAVNSDPQGIGYVGLAQVGNTQVLALSEAGSMPLQASKNTVERGDYVLSRRLYFYVPTAPSDMVKRFLDFAVSADGKRVVVDAHFVLPVPEDPNFEIAQTSSNLSEDLRKLDGTHKLRSVFQFERKKAELDSETVKAVKEAAEKLKGKHDLVVVGYSHKDEGCAIGKQRAGAIAKILKQSGVSSKMKSLDLCIEEPGESENPKSRRVEIFVAH